ncbi:unnamed protein product [Clavelina lepadiformis]|uniref:Uncharacterized protein n=1 Tax=Clavelina lepadiformis TaxID=159417 RepID=A0ABP0G732_CLALP
MSTVSDSSADVQIDEITSVTEMIPDSPDSPVQQSSPAPYVPIVRPGEQGAPAPMPQSADLADIQATVLQPVHRLFRPFKTTVTMPTLAVPAPPTTSAEDLLLWFQQLDELFQLVPDFEFMSKILTMVAATPAFHMAPLMKYISNGVTDKTLEYEQFKQFLHARFCLCLLAIATFSTLHVNCHLFPSVAGEECGGLARFCKILTSFVEMCFPEQLEFLNFQSRHIILMKEFSS